MTFVLRIFFIGLIAFVPSRDGKELTVLLVETHPGHKTSDGTLIAPHQPMLLARAAKCWGHCGITDPDLAGYFFQKDQQGQEESPAHANRRLESALSSGAAWKLDGSDLTLVDAQPSRAALRLQTGKAAEPTNFNRIADLGQIVPAAGTADPDLLACRPQKGLIAGRLRLRTGKVWTYRLLRVDGEVLPFEFKTLKGEDEKTVSSQQPIADWVAAEVEISGDSVEIVENHFGCEEIRTIRLAPENGLVELALMNIPPPPPEDSGGSHPAQESATHFEMYYDLAREQLPPDRRPVPYAVHQPLSPSSGPEPRSILLERLKLGDPKGFYERILCPPALLSEGVSPQP